VLCPQLNELLAELSLVETLHFAGPVKTRPS
jgi:hypothetical protein